MAVPMMGMGSDGEDEVAAVVHERLRNRLAGGLVVLRVLLLNLVGDTGVIERLHKAGVGGIKSAVLGELQHADLVGGAGGGAGTCGRLFPAATGERDGARRHGGSGKTLSKHAAIDNRSHGEILSWKPQRARVR